MNEYDEEILHYFLEHQTQLFPEAVAESRRKQKSFWRTAWRWSVKI